MVLDTAGKRLAMVLYTAGERLPMVLNRVDR